MDMSLIHHRIRDGKPVYRLWSTVCDAYLTVELTYEELVTELRIEAIREALRQVEGHGFKQRMERVHRNGTSDGLRREPLPLDSPWEAERNDGEDEDE
jgi:hypothetical protein